MFPGGAGLWGGWAEAQDPAVPRGPWPHHLLPAHTASGGLRPPGPGGARGHPAAGRGWWESRRRLLGQIRSPSPCCQALSPHHPSTRGKGRNKRRTPSPPTQRPHPFHPQDPRPRAQLTSHGCSHDEGQCQESYAEPGEAHGGGEQRGYPRTSPSRPVLSRPSAVRPVLGWGRAAALAAPAAQEMLSSSLGSALTYSSPRLSF